MTISDAARAAAAAAAAAAREAARKAAEEAARKAAEEAARKAAAQAAAKKAAAEAKLEPRASAPRPTPRPSAPEQARINISTGRTSSFEAFKPKPVTLERPAHAAGARDEDCRSDHANAPSEGRGTNDDSVGRGTNDDSVGRGTNDDSVGRGTNDDSVGRGTNDDSVGRGHGTNDDSVGRGTNDDSVGRGTNDDSVGRGGGARPPDHTGDVGASEEATDRGVALVPGRAGLSPAAQAQMDQLAHAANADKARQANYVFRSEEFQAMPAKQREQIVNVMAKGGDKVSRGMAEMFEQSGGAMLSDTGKDGVTVLDSLEKMANAGEGVVGQVMYDLVNPGRIQQGRAPTCTVSSMQYELAHEAPGEYARLMAGLVVDGKVTMLGGGELVTDAKWDQQASVAAGDMRHASEAIFQAAAMEFANGDDTYLEYSQTSIGGKDGNYRGLHAEQITKMVGELFGVEYKTREIGSDAEADDELKQILSRERPNRPVLFDIMIDGQQSNHLVSLEGVRNGMVIYRDPTTGQRERMSVEEFRQNLVAVHYAEHSTGFFDKVSGAIGAAAGAALGGAKAVGSAVGSAASNAGSVVGNAATNVGHAIGGAFNKFKGLFG